RGRYGEWSLRQTAPGLRRRYFTQEGQELVLHDEVRRAVSFEERNLLDDDPDFYRPDGFDIVFCRNVIMYFTPEAARALIQRLASALAPGGFLFLGPAETLRGISQAFAMRASHDTFYYQRGDQLWESTAPEPVSPS